MIRESYARMSRGIAGNPLVAERTWARQMIKSAFVGVTNTLFDVVLYTALTRIGGVHYLIANVLSFTFAATSSFFLNKRWTFRNTDRGAHWQFLRFFAVSVGGLALNEGVLFFFVSRGVYDLLAKTFGIVLAFFWNFFLYKYWAFRGARSPQQTSP